MADTVGAVKAGAAKAGAAKAGAGKAETGGPEAPGEGGYPRKRARTRRQLLVAGMAAVADHGPDGITVNDIAHRAGVSPGTFYNHFASLPELVAAVTDDLAGGVEIARDQLEHVEHDPAARVAIGTRQLLAQTRVDPASARAFVALFATVPAFRRRVRSVVGRAVDDGIRTGRFTERSGPVTTDAVMGTVVQWMRSRLAGEAGDEPEREHLRLMLTIVGLPPVDAGAVLDTVLRP